MVETPTDIDVTLKKVELETPGKKPSKSQTIQGNVLAILATVGSVAALVKGGVPVDVLVPAVTAAGAAIWGNVMSIFGRLKATKKIQ